MKSKLPSKLYKEQLVKLKRLPEFNGIKNRIVFLGNNATEEEYMDAYKKNRRLWKTTRGVFLEESRINKMKSLKITKSDKKALKKYGYTDLNFLKNHYEAKCLIAELRKDKDYIPFGSPHS